MGHVRLRPPAQVEAKVFLVSPPWTVMRLIAILVGAVSLVGAAEGEHHDTGAEIAKKLLVLTGGKHMRIVWQQRIGELPKTHAVWYPGSADYRLMGFDTRDHEIRELVPGPTRCFAPVFTTDGKQVISYRGPSDDKGEAKWESVAGAMPWNAPEVLKADPEKLDVGTSQIVAWDQRKPSKPRTLTQGWVLHAWSDPKDGVEWLILNRPPAAGQPPVLVRQRLDDQKKFEPVYYEAVYAPGAGISADGTRLSGMFPWPNCGVLYLADQTGKIYHQGSWPNLAPDNSYRSFIINDHYRSVHMFDKDGKNKREIRFDTMPEVDGNADVSAPRWTNDARFVVVSAPLHDPGQSGQNPMSNHADIYVGKFDEAFTKVTDWVRITDDDVYDSFADAWIDPAAAAKK